MLDPLAGQPAPGDSFLSVGGESPPASFALDGETGSTAASRASDARVHPLTGQPGPLDPAESSWRTRVGTQIKKLQGRRGLVGGPSEPVSDLSDRRLQDGWV